MVFIRLRPFLSYQGSYEAPINSLVWTLSPNILASKTSLQQVSGVDGWKAREEYIDRNFRKDTADGDFDKEANFYILKYTKCPFVLLENFFHTNEDECKNILMSSEGQDKIVDAIVESICFIETNGI